MGKKLLRTLSAALIVAAAVAGMAPAANADTLYFDLLNHPAGSLVPFVPEYGLRLDWDGEFNTFSFLEVYATLQTDGPNAGRMDIFGLADHYRANYLYDSSELYFISATMWLDPVDMNQPGVDWANGGAGFPQIDGYTESLTLELAPPEYFGSTPDLLGFNGPLNWRGYPGSGVPGSDSIDLVTNGRFIGFEHITLEGWLETAEAYGQFPEGYHQDYMDWLFVMELRDSPPPPITVVPEPASMTLLGLGLGAMYFRIRRKRR